MFKQKPNKLAVFPFLVAYQEKTNGLKYVELGKERLLNGALCLILYDGSLQNNNSTSSEPTVIDFRKIP